jgi:hypothetical protein
MPVGGGTQNSPKVTQSLGDPNIRRLIEIERDRVRLLYATMPETQKQAERTA